MIRRRKRKRSDIWSNIPPDIPTELHIQVGYGTQSAMRTEAGMRGVSVSRMWETAAQVWLLDHDDV